MENEENQEQVSHRFPPPLGIAKGAIPTFPPRLPFIQIKKENNSTRSAAPTFRLILQLEYTVLNGAMGACEVGCIQRRPRFIDPFVQRTARFLNYLWILAPHALLLVNHRRPSASAAHRRPPPNYSA